MASKKGTKSQPSATHVFDTNAATHVSPHSDAVFFHACVNARRIIIGCGYARGGCVARLTHALAKEFKNMNPLKDKETPFDFLFAADWNKSPQEVIDMFLDAGIPATAIVPDGPTCCQATPPSALGSPHPVSLNSSPSTPTGTPHGHHTPASSSTSLSQSTHLPITGLSS